MDIMEYFFYFRSSKLNISYSIYNSSNEMKEFDKIELNENSINEYSKLFIEQSKSNQFYNKNVFFTENLCGSKYNYFQVIGNLGGIPTQTEFTGETDFFIISDFDFEELKKGNIANSLINLEKNYNNKGKRHTKLKILTESVFIKHIYQRCLEINDNVTLELIKELI